ncbi:MAG TPA: hypothetical protein VD838_19995 [Anaeromyxobacteraceae bacterium]|nr:hypothetical protein [Anaeromyxobacteraceae bacterium]
MRRATLLLFTTIVLACGGGDGGDPGDPGTGDPAVPASPGSPPAPLVPPASGPGWVTLHEETFDAAALPEGAFAPDPVPDDGPYADAGAYFTHRGVTPPEAYRFSGAFGEAGWLTVESYSRRSGARLAEHAAVVADPADASNRVLRIASPEHTDGTVIRPSAALPDRYRVSLRVGFASFGDGVAPNGYDGGERAGPWIDADATTQNGFYWLTILDALPRPHNNVWIHHHRKVVVDSDNHFPPWMEIWDGSRFVSSGVRPVMLIALDGSQPGGETVGAPFHSFSAGEWQPSGAIRAVDRYLPGEWYDVAITRDGGRFTLSVSGRFEHGGEATWEATIDAAERCVFHWPATPEEAARATACEDEGSYPGAPGHPRWPAGAHWPEWFMFGDPHVNFYEGEVLYDDVRLEVWAE